MSAYHQGIFPWYDDSSPILWHCPRFRMVLALNQVRINRSLRKRIRQRPFEVVFDRDFAAVMQACAQADRPGQNGTWITQEMQDAYLELHRLGLAHCVASYQDGQLVGGFYGVSVGGLFCGESMFARVDDASKIAFVYGLAQLRRMGVQLVDCQVHTDHLARFGAREWPRDRFLAALEQLRMQAAPQRPWAFDRDLLEGEFPFAELEPDLSQAQSDEDDVYSLVK